MGAPMRRLSVTPVLIVMLAAGVAVAMFAAAALAGSGPSSGGAPTLTGGGSTGTPSAPASGKVKSVTIAVTPNPVTAGTPIVISGRVRGRTSSGVLVTLWRMLPHDRRFHVGVRVRTDNTGRYIATLRRVSTNTRWYAAAARGTKSRIVSERVRALMTLLPSTSLPSPGDRIVFRVHVTPWHGSDQVQIQRLAPGGWRLLARRRLDGGSNFSVVGRFAKAEVRLR